MRRAEIKERMGVIAARMDSITSKMMSTGIPEKEWMKLLNERRAQEVKYAKCQEELKFNK
jgi:hypothetical protein